MDDLIIRPMDASQIANVAELERICFSSPWSSRSLQDGLASKNGAFYVAEYGGENSRLAGYAGMYHVLDEGYIANIAVFPQYRRRGVATALLRRLEAFSAEHKLSFLTLEVRRSNTAAISLYQKQGFEQKGVRRGFYSLPAEDALIMTKFFCVCPPLVGDQYAIREV